MTLGAAVRVRPESYQGVDFQQGNDRGFVLQRYRFSLGLQPNSWVRLFGEMQDAREAGAPQPNASLQDALDLRQAWAEVGKPGSFWTLTGGRQRLAFGSERVIGAGEWGNTARVFDAVKLNLHHGADRVDLFSGSVVRNSVDAWDHHRDGDNVHGAYASVNSLLRKVVIEPYGLFRTSPSFPGERGVAGHYSSWTYGVRTASAGLESWKYEVEILGQRGRVGSGALRAWGFTALSQRMWNRTAGSPRC